MTLKQWTAFAILLAIVLLVGWEIFVLIGHAESGATISEVVQEAAFRYPILPFFAGVLVGHFFWPIRRD